VSGEKNLFGANLNEFSFIHVYKNQLIHILKMTLQQNKVYMKLLLFCHNYCNFDVTNVDLCMLNNRQIVCNTMS